VIENGKQLFFRGTGALTRPSMSFVPVKGLEQQGLSMLHARSCSTSARS
jgi:hypothetical protein